MRRISLTGLVFTWGVPTRKLELFPLDYVRVKQSNVYVHEMKKKVKAVCYHEYKIEKLTLALVGKGK